MAWLEEVWDLIFFWQQFWMWYLVVFLLYWGVGVVFFRILFCCFVNWRWVLLGVVFWVFSLCFFVYFFFNFKDLFFLLFFVISIWMFFWLWLCLGIGMALLYVLVCGMLIGMWIIGVLMLVMMVFLFVVEVFVGKLGICLFWWKWIIGLGVFGLMVYWVIVVFWLFLWLDFQLQFLEVFEIMF